VASIWKKSVSSQSGATIFSEGFYIVGNSHEELQADDGVAYRRRTDAYLDSARHTCLIMPTQKGKSLASSQQFPATRSSTTGGCGSTDAPFFAIKRRYTVPEGHPSWPRLRCDPLGFRYEFICVLDLQRSGTTVGEIHDKIVGSAHHARKDKGLHSSSDQLSRDRH
jgi:hypothetical protein